MFELTGRTASAAAGGDSRMTVKAFPPPGSGVLSRLLSWPSVHQLFCKLSVTRIISQRPAASGQRPAASGQRPAASGQRPAASGQRPAASGPNCVRASRLGSPSRPEPRSERSRARCLSLLPALALLFGALSLFGAAPAVAQSAGPSNFHIAAATATSITVAWDGVGPGGFYEIRLENLSPSHWEQYRIDNEPGFIAWQPRKFTWGPRYTYTGLTTGSTYRYQVRAGTGASYGPWSETFSVTVGTSAVTPIVTFARTASGTFSGELRDSVTEGQDSTKPPTGSSGLVLNIAPQLSTASTVTVVPRPGTAEAGVDYSTAPFTVELPASMDTVRIPVPLIDNVLSEPNKDVSFFLELEAVDGAPYAIGADRRFEAGPIADDDVVTVSWSVTNTSIVEGITASNTLVLDKDTSYPITVTLVARADDDDDTANATDGVDYRLLVTEVTIPAGERTVKLLNVLEALNDTETEGDEVVLVWISDFSTPPAGRAEVGVDPITITITNSYKSSLSVSPNPVAEGSSATVTVTLSEAPGSAISLPVTLKAGTAESGDFRVSGVSAGTSIQKMVSFAATATSGSFTVTTAQDTDAEDETFTVSVPAGADPVTVRILDDEAGARDLRVLWPWIVPVKLAWNDPTSDPAPYAYDVHYTTDNTVAVDAAAVSGTDPAAGWVDAKQTGSPVSRAGRQLTWHTSAVKRGTEYRFRVRARYWQRSGAYRIADRLSGWTHTSTEIGSHTAVGVVEGIYGAGYESLGRASLRVRLANPVSHQVRVDYATAADTGASNPATEGTDYTAVSGTVTFAPGETEKRVTVPIIDDDAEDSGETFRFVLSNPQPSDKVRLGSYVPGFKDVDGPGPRATVTIFNHEADLKALAVEGAPGGDGPWAALDIGAFAAETTAYAVTVPHGTTHARLTPTALHDKQRLKAGTGSNLQAVGSGAASAAIPLAVGENALVVESSLASGERKTFTVTVTRQAAQAAVAVSLAATPNPVEEGAPVTVRATLATALDEAVTIPLTVTRGTSEDGDHGSLASIEIPVGGTSATGTISTTDDADGDDETFTVALGSLPSGLTAGTASSVEVTITDSGAQQQRTEPLTAAFENVPSEHDGTAFTFDLTLSEAPGDGNLPVSASFKVAPGKASVSGSGTQYTVTVTPKAANAWKDVTITLAGGRACSESGAICTADGRALTNTSSVTVGGPVRIRIEGARAKEGKDASLDFAVTLNRAAAHDVSVDYATEDGTATAGADYTATSGTLTFAAGETAKTVSVPVLDDAIDEGKETMRLLLSNPQGAYLRGVHSKAKGVIRNDDTLQQAWLARFGRMVASDAVASVTARLETPRDAGSHVTFAGQRMNFGEAEGGGGAALATVLTGLARTFGAPSAPAADEDDPFVRLGLTDPWNDPATSTARSMTGRELLLGTSFRAVLGQGAGSQWTSWGQGASVSQFSAAAAGLDLSGESATGSMGMDYEHGRLLTGFAMTHSVGEGTAEDEGWRYALGSTATMAMPYARLALTDRISAWGLAGTGSGTLSLDLDGAVPQRYRTDLSMTLAAAGVRGDLVKPAEAGGFALALKADAFWVRTESEGISASRFGNLAAARGESSRVRAVLDGSRTFALSGGAALTPSVELGLRHDGGDAETGTGVEFGTGLGYADPSRGLDMALKVHGLAVHDEDGYDEWGVSGQLRLVPGGSGRGLSASFTPSYGVGPGGTERLWALPDAHALSANEDAAPSNRLDTEFGYGLPVFGGGFTGTPNVGFGLSEAARDYRIGWRLTPAAPSASGFEVNLDAVRREAANDNDAEHGVMLRSLFRW